MSSRVYMLLDILENKSSYALQVLHTISGVIVADTLEGHPNILVIIEAANRQRLVEMMMPVLDSIDHIAKDVHLLVNRESELVPRFEARIAYQKQSIN